MLPSPRQRFWVATRGWVPLSAVALGLAFSSELGMVAAAALLLLGWVAAVLWVCTAHVPVSKGTPLRARLMLVASGLTIALGVASLFSLALLGAIARALGVSVGGA
ncbi:hypothetical protein GCM10027188_29140 [Lysobacter humi (ex Lee et al. 2017)]